MKSLVLAIAAIGFVLINLPADAKSAKCPSNPVKAGRQLWPAGSVEYGKTVTKRHPCGKRVQCVGAKGVGKKFTRQCKWLK